MTYKPASLLRLAEKYRKAANTFPVFVERKVEMAMETVEARIKAEQFTGKSPSTLDVRTGDLIAALHHKTKVAGSEVTGSVGTGSSPYGRIQDLGGTVRAKSGSALTVPTQLAQSLSLRPRASDFPGLFKITRVGKPPLLARRNGQTLEVLFVLKQEVTIPPGRLGLNKIFKEEAQGLKMELLMKDAVREALNG